MQATNSRSLIIFMLATFSTRNFFLQADKYGVIALGGSSPLVTPGGYILGGGHSPITRMKGLGVDCCSFRNGDGKWKYCANDRRR